MENEKKIKFEKKLKTLTRKEEGKLEIDSRNCKKKKNCSQNMLNILALEPLENHLKGYCFFLRKTAIKITWS